VHSDPRHYNQAPESVGFVTRSILGVPMVIRNRTMGVLEALNKKDDEAFTKQDVQLMTMFGNQAAVAIENARLVAALRRANDQLNELDRRKSDFIAIASHELRTPLNLILGYAAMLSEDARGVNAEQLEGVLKGATQLRSLIDDMVNLQHVDTGAARLEVSEFAVAELIRSVVDTARELADAKHQSIGIDLTDAALQLRADRDKTRIALNNLVVNAVKFTPNEGKIVVSCKQVNDEVLIGVSDNGIGIPAKDLKRVFDRFFQVEPHIARKHGGLGLGLAITKSMVELHGGRIWCESVVGKGSRFIFALPAHGPKPPIPRGTAPLKMR
jgi:signal transduction histidine kinase